MQKKQPNQKKHLNRTLLNHLKTNEKLCVWGRKIKKKKFETSGKVAIQSHLEREVTARIITIDTANTAAPAFDHKSAVFKQGKLLLLAVNKVCIVLLTSEGLCIGYSILIASVEENSFWNADFMMKVENGEEEMSHVHTILQTKIFISEVISCRLSQNSFSFCKRKRKRKRENLLTRL